jgi:hypothetical protein
LSLIVLQAYGIFYNGIDIMRKKAGSGDAGGIKTPLKNENAVMVLIFGIFFAVFAAGALTYAIARPHHWLRAGQAKITSTGAVKNAAVYRSNKGMVLLRLVHPDDSESVYVYLPTIRAVAVPEPGQFSFDSKEAYCKTNIGFLGSDIGNGAVTSVNDNVFEFTASDGALVRTDLGEPLKMDVPHNYF